MSTARELQPAPTYCERERQKQRTRTTPATPAARLDSPSVPLCDTLSQNPLPGHPIEAARSADTPTIRSASPTHALLFGSGAGTGTARSTRAQVGDCIDEQ